MKNFEKPKIKAEKHASKYSQGYNTPIFGYPLNLGSDNPTIVNIVAKYYTLARSGTDPLMFLDCKGYAKSPQTDCRTYSDNGKLIYANRYNIRSESFFHISSGQNFSPSEIFQKFVQRTLHDDGLRVLLLNQLGYDPNNNVFEIKNLPLSAYGTATNAAIVSHS